MAPSTVTWCSAMHSSSADCVFGRGAVDLVGDHDVGEHRAGPELELRGLPVEDRHAGDVAGQQVRGELHAADRAVDGAGQRLGQRGLADARHVLDQQVALGEQGDQRDAHHLGLADDDPLHVAGDPAAQLGHLGRGRRRYRRPTPGRLLVAVTRAPPSDGDLAASATRPPQRSSTRPLGRDARPVCQTAVARDLPSIGRHRAPRSPLCPTASVRGPSVRRTGAVARAAAGVSGSGRVADDHCACSVDGRAGGSVPHLPPPPLTCGFPLALPARRAAGRELTVGRSGVMW